ncbi:MAG: flagellar biosynthesis anti-sigma factor FlgM [Porticoccus sp.]|nr:flagellar biosynthesis anti-sigma factor FlgM [Porticoccus sp.]MBQ0807756.1 flagellar biosynthesis anti-sigma factor FlgM [Porticoccus sp.]MDX2349213.1 flagellar biosynthesis anti-sigma factor FlgM [Porticoccus sp.]
MKINSTTSHIQTQQADQAKAKSAEKATSQSATPSFVAHLSSAATADTSRDIDAARVSELQAAIKDGKLEVNAEKIADSLIESVKDLLTSEAA